MFVTETPDDVRVFCTRARRLDPGALVRLRPGGPGRAELWTLLPFTVLANLTVPGTAEADATVRADALVAWLDGEAEPSRADQQWRGALPTDRGEVLEELPAAECRRIGEAAAATLKEARGKGVGDRRLRDALLDQVVLHVEADGGRHEVPLRLLIGLLRMGFAGQDSATVRVRRSGSRLGLEGIAGAVWGPAPGLALR